MALAIQEALEGKYEILEKIGEGGIGSVYKVRHRLLQELRVIKVLRPQAAAKEELQERFVHEARMAIRLKQPNIAQLHDFAVTADGTAYIVMEYIDGVGLDAMLQASGPPSVDLALEASRQALTALGYLHAHRFVHRDVSPDNLMLTRDFNGNPLVKLIDLGIAKNLEGSMQLTATGVFVGKVRYSSPEQFSAQGGSEEIDHRSDIYSFGVLLYELLTGEMPVSGESFSEVAGGHLFHPPRPFEETDPDGHLDEGLRAVIFKALEKKPERRFDSTDEMIAALEPFRDRSVSLAEEVEQRIVETRELLPGAEVANRPGSTQNRLDAEFGLGTTPAPTLLTEVAAGESDRTTAMPSEDLKLVAGNIDNLIRAGKLRHADKELTRARFLFGDIRPLADLRDRLQAARAAPDGLRRAPWLPWAAGVAVLVAIAGVTWLALGRGGAEAPVADADILRLPQTPARWSPLAEPAVEPLLGDETAPQPPPFAPEEPEPAEAGVRTEPSPQPPLAGGGGVADAAVGGEPRGAEPRGGTPPTSRPEPGDPGPGESPPEPSPTTSDIYPVGGVGVTPPVLLALPPALYPLDRPPKKDQVYVVTVLVDEFGKPMNPSIKRGASFRKRVRDAAIEVAMGARFRPALKEGVAGRMWTDVQVVFAGSE